MKKTKQPRQPEIPAPDKHPEVIQPVDPEEPLTSEEDPDILMEEETIEPPPYEAPPPGEAP